MKTAEPLVEAVYHFTVLPVLPSAGEAVSVAVCPFVISTLDKATVALAGIGLTVTSTLVRVLTHDPIADST
ncbi:hypothetical protein D3C87_1374900 [compost metagenome]